MLKSPAFCRSHWPRGLKRGSAIARLLRLWVWIPSGERMFVCYERCVLSVRGLCDELITCLEESYQPWCVAVCDLETSRMRGSWSALVAVSVAKNKFCFLLTECCLDAFVISRRAAISFVVFICLFICLPVCLCVHIDSLGTHWIDFNGIWHLSIFRKICRKDSGFIKIWQE